jgi:hypothetical protein
MPFVEAGFLGILRPEAITDAEQGSQMSLVPKRKTAGASVQWRARCEAAIRCGRRRFCR